MHIRPRVLALVALLGAGACDTLVDADDGLVSENEIPVERRGTIPLLHGYLDGKAVEYYRVGQLVPDETDWFPSYDKFPGMPVRELYVWPDAAGAPSFQGGQRPIVDSLPRQASASDFLEIVLVKPPAGAATPNDIKSRATLLRAGYELTRTGKVVNCPIVGKDGKLGGAPASHYPKLELWYRKKTTSCILLDGGPNVPAPKTFSTPIGSGGRNELRVAATDLYTLRSTAFSGADLVSAIPVPPGWASYMKIWALPVSGWNGVETPPRSLRSHKAKSGSRAMQACSAACRPPAKSRCASPISSIASSGMSNQTATVLKWLGGRSRKSSPITSSVNCIFLRKPTTLVVTSTSPR